MSETQNTTSDLTVSRTILHQLGGRMFLAMTGAKNCIGGDNHLTFTLPSNGFCRNQINACRVTLMPSDTYRVEFLSVRGFKVRTVSDHDDIYAENLRELFGRETGLALSLGNMGVQHA